MTTENDSDRPDSLRSKLLESEPINAERLHRLKEQVQSLSDYRLNKRMRMWWRVGLGTSILFAVFGMCVVAAGSLDWPLRIVWWLYTAGNVFVACFAAITLHRGRCEPNLYFWFGVLMVTLALGCFIALFCRAAASPTAASALGVGFGEFCVVIDLILFLYGRITWAHLSTTEHLLRLELLMLDSTARAITPKQVQ